MNIMENDLPDFDEMVEMVENISELSYTKSLLEIALKARENAIMIEAVTESKHFLNGKPRPITFIKDAWIYSGFDCELLDARKEMAKLSSEVWKYKMLLDLMKAKIDVWRTLSANERKAIL